MNIGAAGATPGSNTLRMSWQSIAMAQSGLSGAGVTIGPGGIGTSNCCSLIGPVPANTRTAFFWNWATTELGLWMFTMVW